MMPGIKFMGAKNTKAIIKFFIIVSVFGLGVLLRVIYLDWGIPNYYRIGGILIPGFHPDEPVLINQIQHLLQSPFDFSVFTYPPLQAQISAICAWLTGLRSLVDLYLIARMVSVVASILTIGFVWMLGRLVDNRVGLNAAILLGFSMEACHQAHWANPESLCTLGIIAATYFALKGPWRGNFFWSGLFLGLSICAKYFGVFFLHLPLVAIWISVGNLKSFLSQWKRITLFYLTVFIVVLVDLGCYLYLHYDKFIEFVRTNSSWAHGAGLFGMSPAPVLPPSYSFAVLPFNVGIPIYLLALTGIIVAIYRGKASSALLLIPFPFWAFIETLNYKPPRFSLHLLPFLALFAALAIFQMFKSSSKWVRESSRIGLMLVIVYSLAYSFAFIRCLDKDRDARRSLEKWVSHNDPQTTALIGIDEVNYRIGLCRYNHSIGLSGKPIEQGEYTHLVVPEIFQNVLMQWVRLSDKGYRYTRADWWPANLPDDNLGALMRDLTNTKKHRLVLTLRNKPEIFGVNMEAINLPFSYFWISNLKFDIYEKRTLFPPP